jgi:hypothetical protein
LFGGTYVLQNHRWTARLVPKLATQLVPAAIVTVVGVLMLGNLTKAPDIAPAVAPVPTAIKAEAVFTATPRPAEEEQPARAAAARPLAKPKAVAVNIPTPPRKPADEPRQTASAPAPLPIVQIAAQPQVPPPEPTLMGRVWGATTAVAGMPVRAAQSVTGWFAAAVPPRPPAPVPLQEFQAAM